MLPSSLSITLPVNVIESYRLNEEPVAGAVIATIGAVFTDDDNTVTLIASESERPPLSVAEAVMVCVPSESVDVENAAPLPMTPSRFERHDRLSEMLPSSLSITLPVNVIESYRLNEEPVAGAVIATIGAVFTDDDNTVTLIASESGRPPLSVAEAVMLCVPSESVDVENAAPLPMTPSRFERHDRLSEMLPSSLSVTLPVNVIESYRLNEEPVAGAVMVTSGAVFPGVEEL